MKEKGEREKGQKDVDEDVEERLHRAERDRSQAPSAFKPEQKEQEERKQARRQEAVQDKSEDKAQFGEREAQLGGREGQREGRGEVKSHKLEDVEEERGPSDTRSAWEQRVEETLGHKPGEMRSVTEKDWKSEKQAGKDRDEDK
jgi:hypothetical protein